MKIHRDALANATDEQLKALRDNVLKHWQHVPDEGVIIIHDLGTLMVYLRTVPDQPPVIVVGIEPDGYTHS